MGRPKKKPVPAPEYRFRQVSPNVNLTEEEIQIVGEELARLCGDQRLNGISPEQVVLAAQSPHSPLHKHIYAQWSDKEAAHKWRTRVARELIASIVFVPAPSTPEVRAFTHVGIGDRKGYFSTPDVRGDQEVVEAKRRHAYTSLRAWLSEFEFWADPGSQLEQTVNMVRRELEAVKEI